MVRCSCRANGTDVAWLPVLAFCVSGKDVSFASFTQEASKLPSKDNSSALENCSQLIVPIFAITMNTRLLAEVEVPQTGSLLRKLNSRS